MTDLPPQQIYVCKQTPDSRWATIIKANGKTICESYADR
jgi:hypothetical protein